MRYPLKSARGERLESVDLAADGLVGDRAWACVDAADGSLGSAKHPRRWARLLEVGATSAGPGSDEVLLEVAGRTVHAGSAEADAVLSEHVGREVRLASSVPAQARLHRQLPDEPAMVPEWTPSAAGAEVVNDLATSKPGGRFTDYGAVHLLTTGALARLARQLDRPSVDAERFRANLVLDLPADPLPGQELRIGQVVLRVSLPTPRCLVPALTAGRPQHLDRELLGVLAREHRTTVGTMGRAACFGVYADVVQPGQLAVGQSVRSSPPGDPSG